MADPAHVLVVDIGKTNAKLALVATDGLAEIDVLARPNRILPGPPYPHPDADALWDFVTEGAATLQRRHGIDAITVTTHGAAGALVAPDGALALPILDYEHDGPDELAADYDRVRPAFAETGSPRLERGLNLGAQLFWQSRRFPDAFARAAHVLPYPQYWAYRLSGIAATEVTSLAAHSDLWSPSRAEFSPLVDALGWRRLMPPLRRAADRLGPVTPGFARATGLDPATPVFCGLHDSNASLVPHLVSRKAPFAVVSTGTWIISMAIGGRAVALDPARDTLLNVNGFGAPVPSARFMGGREHARLTEGAPAAVPGPAEIAAVLARGAILLPAIETGSGPFRGRVHSWSPPEAALAPGDRAVVIAFYLALVTATCLAEIGADGPTCLEGPFARDAAFAAMLAAATGRPVEAAAEGGTGTAPGAALLTLAVPSRPPAAATRYLPDPALAAYAAGWRARLEG